VNVNDRLGVIEFEALAVGVVVAVYDSEREGEDEVDGV
jgi:hypothetical protein